MTDSVPLAPLEQRTVPVLLDQSAVFGLERRWMVESWTGRELDYGTFLSRVSATAHKLAAQFEPGTHLGLMLGNHLEFVILRYALSCAGLVEVSLNGDQKGAVLKQMLEVAAPAAIMVDPPYVSNLLECGFDTSQTVIVKDTSLEQLCADQRAWSERPQVALQPSDPCRILFTSGTTGVSKGVVLSHAYEVFVGHRWGEGAGLTEHDNFLYTTRLFHADAQGLIGAFLHTGCSCVITERFSASQFWDTIVEFEATSFLYVGTILAIINRVGDPPDEHSLRIAFGAGCSEALWGEWERKTGVEVLESFGMSECLACTVSRSGASVRGAAGRALPSMDIAILDPLDQVVPPGTRGEIAIRSTEPFALMSGYLNHPDITLERFRNFWFHSGDLGSMDADGNLYFHGRMKDCVRVKGENISAEELQAIVDSHPDVVISAAVGVPSELGDEDILLYVQARSGYTVQPEAICEHVARNAVQFMVPRYIRFVTSLPVSVSEKVSKTDLPRTLDDRTWERRDVRRST